MRRYGEAIVRLIGTRTLEDCLADEALRYALNYLLLVVGEASIHIPIGDKTALKDVPWQHLKGLRNRLAHAYFAVEPAMVYLAARNNIPELLRVLPRCDGAES